MSTTGIAERLDAAIAEFFSGWNIYTPLLIALLVVFLTYSLLTGTEPDTHPFLLARQAQIAPIRHQGESAVYRAVDIPHGYPLRAGLGVKDPGAPRWSTGRPGDLRDIWRTAVRGAAMEDGTPTGEKGKIITILGSEKVVEHQFDDLTLAINVIGQYVKRNNGQSVAVCLSNSVELLSVIFAGSFYGFSTVLLPYGLPQDKINSLLAKTSADHVIAEAGVLNLDSLPTVNKALKDVIWVTQPGSQHMDWADDAPEGFTINSWQGLVEKNKRGTNSEVLPLDKDSKVPPVSIFCEAPNGSFDLVKYTSENLISGTAALTATLTRAYKLSPSDMLHPTTSLTDSYTLCWTLAALYANASVALNSVAGDNVDLVSAASPSNPTIVIAAPPTVQTYLYNPATVLPSAISKYMSGRTLENGNLPSKSGGQASLPKMRLLLIPQPAAPAPQIRLPSSALHTLRTHLHARIGYALTTPSVAGAIAQTNILDYRDKGSKVCVGAPLSSVEVNLTGEEDVMGSHDPKGVITVKGPAVVGGKITLDIESQIDEDHTLLLP
ncbi:hypothetical protein LTR10_013800 [Elasticomyces elasticus]|uniref:AMP-dependent synthetase/ligase domain-containing protein n=1 Tax=Exophiala sideris TaxID=1016849 RepID=A0ABR0JH77_9EURO|nr:hypothetical protein LTR10_013800 [Elasticomyces elasticus]KAK5033225.1 hypothetical protein LTS07_003526 [Exophiala sideris]KAK5042278.1 hypothetical protein LTR13_002084 [Exophiala sideris]KAK5063769.1 hypothetical protein LTR69_003534 [Exophiala sideris]KAK5185546.1 hypothetical protein LTR44_002535 [Eurotiomycetes sp. CCFEE 6388]